MITSLLNKGVTEIKTKHLIQFKVGVAFCFTIYKNTIYIA